MVLTIENIGTWERRNSDGGKKAKAYSYEEGMGTLGEVDESDGCSYWSWYGGICYILSVICKMREAQEHITSGGSTFETYKGYQQQTPWVGIANTNQKLMLQAASEFGLTSSLRSRIVDGNGKAKWLWGGAEKSEWVDEIVGSLLLSVEKSADDGRLAFIYIFAKITRDDGKKWELSMHNIWRPELLL